jgi:phage tail sheath protein FI
LGDPNTIGLALQASSPGVWGKKVTVQVLTPTVDPTVVTNLGYASAALLFDLKVVETGGGATETIRNVSVVEGTRRLDRVLAQESQLVTVPIDPVTNQPVLPLAAPAASAAAISLSGGSDGGIITSATSYSQGVNALENADIFNLLCIPPDGAPPDNMFWNSTGTGSLYTDVYTNALTFCRDHRAVLIADPPFDWDTVAKAQVGPAALNLVGFGSYGAIYFPNVLEGDPMRKGQITAFSPSGAVAGVISRTDTERGVWKAPAGTTAGLAVQGLTVQMNDDDNGHLNSIGVNCLRRFPFTGNVVWGARTMRGADALTDDYKYLPVRRLALFLEESLFRGTQWVVFEPNDEPLWAQIRLNVRSFMQDLFKKGAFAGTTPSAAFLVKCDSTTTTPFDQSVGVVNIVVGFAPLRPAEFVVLQIQQLAGQTA